MAKKMNFLKYGSFLFTAFIGVLCIEGFLLPLYIYTNDIVYLIGVLSFPILTSISILISRVLFIAVEVSNEGIIWRLFGKVLHQVKWIDIEHITIEPKMMNISIVLQTNKSDEVLYFNGGKTRLKKVLYYCSNEELNKSSLDFS